MESKRFYIGDGACESGPRIGERAPVGVSPSRVDLKHFLTIPFRNGEASVFVDVTDEHIFGRDRKELLRLGSINRPHAPAPDRVALHNPQFSEVRREELHRRICDELGLSYELFGATDAYQDCGVFDVGASVAHEKVPDLVEAILTLLDELLEHGVKDEELERARRRHRWDLLAALDAASEVSAYYARERLFGRREDFASLIIDAAKVTKDDLDRVARATLGRDRARVACVGEVGEPARRRLLQSLRVR